MTARDTRIANLKQALKDRILIIDGAMGSMIQSYGLEEADYRGDRLANYDVDIKGNNDLLSITQPHIIEEGSIERKKTHSWLKSATSPARGRAPPAG